ncbi:MAG TPA: NUDIX domain-containing protein, partial [Gemmatimonadales bacterium]|nr:NUDIX domain-containing protein [Gemmatimonadales bacterium]
AAKKELSPPQWRTLAEWVFRKFPDRAVVQVERIKARALQSVSDEANDAINAFQWSKARLSKDNPEGLAAVQRFEADSKFFRSFVVVLTPLVIVLPFIGRPIPAAVVAALLLPALWRYADQRFKATQQAYWHVITLEVATEPGATRATSSGSDDVTHAGGLISRIRCGPAKAGGIAGSVHEYLLVGAKKKPVELVLPKGHIEPGEESSVTAVREVLEETGQPARLIDLFKDVRLGKDDATPLTRLWRMSPVEDRSDASIAWRRENRQVRWLALEDEEIGRCFPETVKVLKEAEEMRAALKPPKPAATSEAATDGVAALPVRSNG